MLGPGVKNVDTPIAEYMAPGSQLWLPTPAPSARQQGWPHAEGAGMSSHLPALVRIPGAAAAFGE